MLSFSAIRPNTGIFQTDQLDNTVIVLFAQCYNTRTIIVLLFCPVPVTLLSGANRDGKHR
jgi:hypothetical protein